MDKKQEQLLKERNAELERELEIEASLECVRMVAMAMQNSDDLAATIDAFYRELERLSIAPKRFGVALIDGETRIAELCTKAPGDSVHTIRKAELTGHPVLESLFETWLQQTEYYPVLRGNEIKAYHQVNRPNATFTDYPDDAVQYGSFFSFSEGGVWAWTDKPLPEKVLHIYRRFTKVLDLTYKRYKDLKLAEEQTREAQTEAALERVRTVAMGMRIPSDLLNICEALFNELRTLKFGDLRNALIQTYFNEQNYLLDYDYSDFMKGHINRISYKGYPIVEKFIQDIQKSKDAFAEIVILGEELEKWKKFRSANNETPDERLDQNSALYYYFYSVGDTSIGISTFSRVPDDKLEILKRFRNVFDLAYRRYVDIKQAEEQAREAQIEAALERVRSRSIGMQKSDELKEVIQIVFDQFVHLNIGIDHTGFVVDYKPGGDWHFWVADHIGSPNKLTVANFESVWNTDFDNAKKNNINFFTTHLDFEAKNKFYRDMFGHMPELPQEYQDNILSKAGLAASTVLQESVALYMENFAGTPYTDEENVILMRFGKVFQQTYTRFLDLQKAEEQAKESQVQLALERVRARTMAMQKSEELAEVIQVIHDQLVNLGLDIASAGFIMDYKDSDDLNAWVTRWGQTYSTQLYIPYFDHPIFDLYIDAKERGLDFYTVMLTKEEKDALYTHVFDSIQGMTEERKARVFNLPGYADSHVLTKDVVLYIQNFTGIPYSDAENNALKRFGSAFQQTYTRFNDLKKAEEQARESQIQLALERVRARTLAMQKSDELSETVYILFQQFKELGQNPDQATIGIINEEERVIEYWVTMYGNQENKVFKFSIDEPNVTRKIYDGWKKHKKSLVIDLSGKELLDFAAYRQSMGGAKLNKDEKRRIINVAFFSKGLINVQSTEERSEESINLLERFAGVFDGTYTRFLDLQNAEAQVREAQIEAALEKVRSRSLAMHKTDELNEVVSVVFEKLHDLGIVMDQEAASIVIFTEGSKDLILWNAIPEQSYSKSFHIPYYDTAVIKTLFDAKIAGIDFFERNYTSKEKDHFWQWAVKYSDYKNIPDERKKRILESAHFACSVAFTKNSAMLVSSYKGKLLSEKEGAILKRFARVFEQAYVRFLDLQKAEEQAHESQIQLALERVRARTSAMQKSDELAETVSVLFKQLLGLGIPTEQIRTCGIVTFDNNKSVGEQWITDLSGDIIPRSFMVPYDEAPAYKTIYKWWKQGKEFEVNHLEGDALHEHLGYLAKYTKVPLNVLSEQSSEIYNHVLFFSQGCLFIITRAALPEYHDVFKRFGAVFRQSYTRFLDLQKAEEQTRESQVQLALERVRARTMAMQKSEELNEVIQLVFDQFNQLNFKIDSANFMLNYQETNDFNLWIAVAGTQYATKINVPYFKHPLFDRFKKAKQKTGLYVDSISKEEKDSFFEHFFNYLPKISAERKALVFDQPGFSRSIAFMRNTALTIINYQGTPFSDTENNILLRFGQAFDQTYTRFNDLKQAEAQARESQIQLALERVRARTMAMQHSEELAETSGVLFQQLRNLGIVPERVFVGIPIEGTRKIDFWGTEQGGTEMNTRFEADSDAVHSLREVYKAWRAKASEAAIFLKGDDLEEHLYYMADILRMTLKRELIQEQRILYCTYFSKGFLTTVTPEVQSEETLNILRRFAAVFDQTYTRFLDLEKAEKAAREAQIEAALERVRSKTMAMHNSADVGETVTLMFNELVKLGVDKIARCGIAIPDNTGVIELWTAKLGKEEKEEMIIGHVDTSIHPMLTFLLEAWKSKQADFEYLLEGDDLTSYITAINNSSGYPIKYDMGAWGAKQYHNDFFFHEGMVFAFTALPLSTEIAAIFKRFAGVFGQTYRRYLDLQKAEAQVREAQIEAALERVRSKAMAMRSSSDLNTTSNIVFVELRKLGIDLVRCGVGLMEKHVHTATIHAATNSAGGSSLEVLGTINMDLHPVCEGIYRHWEQNKDYFPVLEGESLTSYYKALGRSSVSVPDWKSDDKQYGYFLPFTDGSLYAWSVKQESEATVKTLKRFASVFGLTHTRYLELKRAELNTKEAIKQASLDRVRAEIASMRTRGDLERITPLIWEELTVLGIPFIRCGVFIMDEEQQLIHTFLSTPDGRAIGAFHVSFDASRNFENIVNNWRLRKSYTDHWDLDAFEQFAETLLKQGAITSKTQYLKTMPGEGIYLNFLPFLQGMLYVGNAEPLSDDHLNLVQAIADAFSTAYARYEDFNKLEAAKQEVDNTLTQLKATQNKLIQSEKMASLGELTAGIAHEIQNPLNFVNNFSEVSAELIDEMDGELDKGDIEEAKAIAGDIRDNLKKIRHHGGRADGIVKGMLQHSRASSNVKEPTDINKLADEYLHLAYHGLRAKDKSFNADLIMNFDKKLPKANVVPQDIGRVILNMINNAFYATQQKGKTNGAEYKPAVEVSTSVTDGSVEISVKDNGNGIPENIKGKIMQPFFTTKPTGEGTGLGLSLSYDIVVKGHGGNINMNTKEGEFTEFVVSLPA